ncbi:hypothetical protein ABFB09_05610 [Dehalogenimonas sp. THU2]|uniref:hypothetical protein n=1 Tax=Dehalogenimonas sp. THU2 TaxID=3151121 RepID=UPI003218968E
MIQRNNSPAPKRRGAPAGNRNACTHGYYSKGFIENARRRIQEVTGFTGIDGELFLSIYRMQLVIKHDPDNVRVQQRAMASFMDMVRRKYDVGHRDVNDLAAAMNKVRHDFALPPETLERLRSC